MLDKQEEKNEITFFVSNVNLFSSQKILIENLQLMLAKKYDIIYLGKSNRLLQR